tara:strand:+ start:9599 stop:9991 length:393 start_codon:yes stop_codon:yes gene_type:complete
MANPTITTTLADTARKLVLKHTQTFNDTGSQSDTLVDISTKDYTAVAVERVWLSASHDAQCRLQWDADVDVLIAAGVLDSQNYCFDFTLGGWGGVTQEGANPTGDLIVQSASMGTTGEQTTIIVEMRKIF